MRLSMMLLIAYVLTALTFNLCTYNMPSVPTSMSLLTALFVMLDFTMKLIGVLVTMPMVFYEIPIVGPAITTLLYILVIYCFIDMVLMIVRGVKSV